MDGVTPNGRHSTDIGGISNVAFQVGPKFVQIRWRPQPSPSNGHCNSAQIGFYGVEARWKPQRSIKNKTKGKKIARDSMQVQKIQSNLRTLGPPLVDSQQKPSLNCSNGPKIQSKLVSILSFIEIGQSWTHLCNISTKIQPIRAETCWKWFQPVKKSNRNRLKFNYNGGNGSQIDWKLIEFLKMELNFFYNCKKRGEFQVQVPKNS